MSHMYRRCSKCGATQASNPELRMHRFPALAKNNENRDQLFSWAMFCYPEKDWSDLEALRGLQKSCKVICSRHFTENAYTSVSKIRLQKCAMPCLDENGENLHVPAAGPLLKSAESDLLSWKSDEVVNSQLKENPHNDNIKTRCIKLIRENVDFTFLNDCPEHLSINKEIIEQSSTIILIKRFCVLENRKFASESAKKRLAKKIKILKNS